MPGSAPVDSPTSIISMARGRNTFCLQCTSERGFPPRTSSTGVCRPARITLLLIRRTGRLHAPPRAAAAGQKRGHHAEKFAT